MFYLLLFLWFWCGVSHLEPQCKNVQRWDFWGVTGSWELWPSQWINPLIGSKFGGQLGDGNLRAVSWIKGVRSLCVSLWLYIISQLPGPPSFLLPTSILPSVRWAALVHPMLPATMFCLTIAPKTMESNGSIGLKPLKQWTEINLSSLKFISLRYFVTVIEC